MTRINLVVAALAAVIGLVSSEAKATPTVTKEVVIDCLDGRTLTTEVECSVGQFINVMNRCNVSYPTLFKVECTAERRSVYFSVGAGVVYFYGSGFDDVGAVAGEANFEIAVPMGNNHNVQFLAQASFGGGDGVLSGSGGLGFGFILNGDPDQRPAGSTRLGILFNMRGLGDGDSQDFLMLNGKFDINISLGKAWLKWSCFLASEGGGTIYDEDGVTQNDGYNVTGVFGFLGTL